MTSWRQFPPSYCCWMAGQEAASLSAAASLQGVLQERTANGPLAAFFALQIGGQGDSQTFTHVGYTPKLGWRQVPPDAHLIPNKVLSAVDRMTASVLC